jgi:hypothetical protein
MSEHFQTDRFDVSRPNPFTAFLPLPSWLARRVLAAGEEVTWVRGPRLEPRWEPYVTHPALFLVALAVAAVCLAVARVIAGSWDTIPIAPPAIALVIVMGSICVLAFFNGYFTRLVVTNRRLLILQGFEVRHSWGIDQLPRSLLRYGRRDGGLENPTIDLDALQLTLGASPSAGFVEAKTIQAFAKKVKQLRKQGDDTI